MKRIHFYKMHGAGNDFILIDNREGLFQGTEHAIFRELCKPHAGIGANGVMLLEGAKNAHFRLRYFNSNGTPAEMCGNGARCAAYLAYVLKIAPRMCSFRIDEALYHAQVQANCKVRLKMQPVKEILLSEEFRASLPEKFRDLRWLKTGVPHLILRVDIPLEDLDVELWGEYLRNLPIFRPPGINVNFVKPIEKNLLQARVYERGVEAETLACGTGAVACGVYAAKNFGWNSPVSVSYPGGILRVEFDPSFEEVFLSGPVVMVFEGDFSLEEFSGK